MEALAILVVIGVLIVIFVVNKSPARQPTARPTQGAPLHMLPEQFVVVDLETTGLDADRHEIIEIGAIKVNRDSDDHLTFSTLVMPTGRISARITEITGIDRDMVKAEGRDLRTAMEAFREFVGDLPLVAFNAEFDVAFLQSACRRSGVPHFVNRSSCALKMAREAWPGRRSYRLSNLCRDAGITIEGEHRALPDCQRAMLVYVAAARALGRA